MHERIRSFDFVSKRLGTKVESFAAEGSSGWKESRYSLLEVEVGVCCKLAGCILAGHKVTAAGSLRADARTVEEIEMEVADTQMLVEWSSHYLKTVELVRTKKRRGMVGYCFSDGNTAGIGDP